MSDGEISRAARLDAYYLPGLSGAPVTTWPYDEAGSPRVELRVAQLTPALLTRQIDRLLSFRTDHLANRPVLEIAASIGRVAERFLDPHDELRLVSLSALRGVVGLSLPMAERVLDGMAADWREEKLIGLLKTEFGDPRVLDEFVTLPGRPGRSRALGPRLTVQVFSGNVPGVSVTSLIRSLLVKSATLGKTAAGEPVLAPLFARALGAEDEGIGGCLAVTYWAGGDEDLEAAALARADAVIAYGGSNTVESVRRSSPPGVPFLGYGHRVSLGVLAREAMREPEATRHAEAAAMAVSTFDQQGCVSPHVFYVEEGGEIEPREWARLLAAAMDRLESILPRGKVAPGEAASIRQARGDAEFGQLAGRGHELHASPGTTAWTAIFDPDPRFAPSCLNRLVRVKPVASLMDAVELVRPVSAVLQTVGLAGPHERLKLLATQLAGMGASRITSLDRMPWPPPEWHHDGRPPLSDLVRWCDWE
ncbi:MAG: acyl-CoA reductase [Gemmatimonadota bacterium]